MTRACALGVLLALAGCSKCGSAGDKAESVERVLPKGAVGVVIAPSLAVVGTKLTLLQGLKVTSFAAQLQGFGSGKELGDALVARLGLDVRNAEALDKAGIDGARGGAVAVLVTGRGFLALPVKDPQRFERVMASLAEHRLGAGVKADVVVDQTHVTTFATAAGQKPRLCLTFAHGFALVTDDAGASMLASMAILGESDSLASDPRYRAAVAALPPQRELVAYLPEGSPALMHAPFSGVTVSASLTASGLSVAVDATAKDSAQGLAALVPSNSPAASLTSRLPEDAFLRVRFQGDASALGPWSKELMGPTLQSAFEQAGFDLKTEVLAQLEPGGVASLSLSDRPPMDRGLPAFDLRETNPFTYVHLSGVAPVKSEGVALPALEKVATFAPRFGANMEVRSRDDGQKAVVTTYAQGEGVHFAPKGKLVFFASPIQRLDALVRNDGRKSDPGVVTDDAALSVALDLRQLARSVRALPESAWGLGGFALKTTTSRWLDATDDLLGVTLTASAQERVLHARLQLQLKAPTP